MVLSLCYQRLFPRYSWEIQVSTAWLPTNEARFRFLKKTCFYRLKSNPAINWRMILWKFSIQFVKVMGQNSERQDKIKCLILDDSLLEKTGKTIERISRVWDHVKNRRVLGYKLNLMGYWDGFSFIPVDFSLHREKGKNKKKPFGLTKKDIKNQFKKKRGSKLSSYERAKEADETKIETGLTMFKRAIKKGLKVDYLLMDSCFSHAKAKEGNGKLLSLQIPNYVLAKC